jgi:uncharacterized protein YcnI
VHPRTPRLIAVGLGLGAVLATAGPAAAHVTAGPAEVPAGGFTAVTLTVPHGCEDSPTTQLAIQIPEGINDVTPAIVPGWNIEIGIEALPEPIVDAHGNELTERESVVTYVAEPGNELQDGFRQSYTIGFKAPDTPGETLFFKSIQTCTVGETAWIEEFDGEGEEPDHPAPAVAVVESEGDGHGASSDDTDDDEADVAEVDTETAAATTDDDSDSSTGIAIAGLAAGALGLLTGGAALARSRKTPAS